jgi:hypothetical protein
MKIVIAALLAGSAAAFAPAQQKASSSALAAKPFADALGAQAPVSTSCASSVFFSPLPY